MPTLALRSRLPSTITPERRHSPLSLGCGAIYARALCRKGIDKGAEKLSGRRVIIVVAELDADDRRGRNELVLVGHRPAADVHSPEQLAVVLVQQVGELAIVAVRADKRRGR